MPLFDLSTNIQESEAASRKRSHDEFVQGTLGLDDSSAGFESLPSMPKSATESGSHVQASVQDFGVAPSILITANSPPSPSSSPDAMTEAGSSTPAQNSPSPNQTPSPSPNPPAPAASTSAQSITMTPTTPAPATSGAKRKRKTTPEREADEQEKKAKKAKAEAEKEAKREADELKKAEKEAKRRKKEEEEEKKKRQQPSLFAFLKPKQIFNGPPTPKKQTASKPADGSPTKPVASADVASPSIEKPSKPEKTAYERMFYDFFVKSDVTMAPSPFYMTPETKETKTRILDEYIRNERGEFDPRPFNPIETFQFSGLPVARGIQRVSVKKLMSDMFGDGLVDDASGVQRTESQQVRVTSLQDQLNSIPIKILSYYEDVRPAYVGTVTSTPTSHLQKLARRPTKRLLKLNYDYESEAEWEEEEGEDLDDDEDEDEENEADEEMADFLDDAEAEDAASRPAFLGDSEPTSTGICFEDRKQLSRNVNGDECATVYKYRMEFLLESLAQHHSIDPFSTEYWQPKVQPKAVSKVAVSDPAAGTQTKITSTAGMAPPPVPRTGQNGPALVNAKDMIDQGLMQDFKKAVVSSDINFLTRVGIVDMLSKRFPSATKAQVRATLEFVAERCPVPGEKKSVKQWGLRPEHALEFQAAQTQL